jgi:hypothetical protein
MLMIFRLGAVRLSSTRPLSARLPADAEVPFAEVALSSATARLTGSKPHPDSATVQKMTTHAHAAYCLLLREII